MDVKLPDGTVIQNVPDGITQKELLDSLAQGGYDVGPIQRQFMFKPGKEGLAQAAKEVGESQSAGSKIASGIGNQFQRMAAGIGELASPVNQTINPFANTASNIAKRFGYSFDIPDKDTLNVGQQVQRGSGALGTTGAVGANLGAAFAAPSAFATAPRAVASTALLEPEDRIQAGLTAGALNLLTRGLTGSLITPSDATKKLLPQGVVPTIGQNAAGLEGKMNRMIAHSEENIQSFPVVGDFITASRLRALDEWRKAAMNQAAPPGATITAKGDKGVEQLRQAYDDAYSAAFGNSQFKTDLGLLSGLANAPSQTRVPLSNEGLKQYWGAVDRNALSRIPQQGMSAQLAKKQIEGDLGKLSREFMDKGTMEQVTVGEALKGARDAVRSSMRSQMPAQDAAKLAPLDRGYPDYKSIATAAERAKGQLGGFTPRQLQEQARPGSAMRGLADAAQEILPTKIPNSFSANRLFWGNLLASGGGSVLPGATTAAGFAVGGVPGAALGFAPIIYSRPFLNYQMSAPDWLRTASPAVAQGLLGFREY